MASPAIRLSADGVTYNAPGVELSVSPGAQVWAKLDNSSDVDETDWEIASTDETATSFTLTTSGIGESAVTFHAGAAGTALLLQSTINAGVDKASGVVNYDLTRTRVKVWVPTTSTGAEVICYDEKGESGPYWWLPQINTIIRNGIYGAANAGDGLGFSAGSFYVVAANPSIVVSSSGVSVGVLQSDAMHANRGNGSLHTVADASNNGFMPAGMWTQLNAATSSAVASTLALRGSNAEAFFGFVGPSGTLAQTEGFVRMPSASTAVAFRNAGNTADLSGLAIDASDNIEVGDPATTLVLLGENATQKFGLASVTTTPGQQTAIGPAISIPSNTAFTWEATFTGKIVGPSQVVLFHQRFLFQVGDYGSLVFNTSLGAIDATSAWKVASPTQPWSTTTGVANSLTVTAVADDGTGRCQLTCSTIGSVRQGSTVLVANVLAGCNGPRFVESVSGNNIVLRGTTYSAGYTSGGTVVVQACVTTGGPTNPLQFYAEGLEAAKWTAGEVVLAGDFRQTNAGDVYQYTRGGTVDGSTAPSSHSTGVTDGTATCDYVGSSASTPSISWTFAKLEQIQM